MSPRCTCRKWGEGCNPSCACHASSRCKNRLNAILPAIFEPGKYGENLPTNDCFAQFLAKEVNLDPGDEDFEDLIEALRNRLIGHAYGNLYVGSMYDDSYRDKYLDQWSARWSRGFMIPMQREAHLISLLRYGLMDNAEKGEEEKAFYSFCEQRWVLKSRMSHCRSCGTCRNQRHWYCGKCKSCSHGLKLPCKGCGGVCDRYFYDEVSDTDSQSEDGSDTVDD